MSNPTRIEVRCDVPVESINGDIHLCGRLCAILYGDVHGSVKCPKHNKIVEF